jgi:hypothetical protein
VAPIEHLKPFLHFPNNKYKKNNHKIVTNSLCVHCYKLFSEHNLYFVVIS